MSLLEQENIVCISSIDWDPIWTRKQQVMSRLPKSNKILYVEPPITLISPFKDPSLWGKWRLWRQGIRKLQENLYLWSPPVILPFGNKHRLINRLNQWWLALFLRRIMKNLDMENNILWTYMPNSADITDLLEHKLLVYDCVDEHSEYTGLINKQVMLHMEQDLLRQCDFTFVTAAGLYNTKKDFARRMYYLPNAANVELFMQAQNPATLIPAEMAAINRPVIGFVGVIQDWVDLDLIARVAKSYPAWSVVMIGPVGVGIDISGLQKLPNVHLLGRKDVKELPGYIKAFDVCLNAFKLNELTDKVSPLKFYEYLAAGKPIVTVNMPGVREFADIVEIANTADEFVSAVARAVQEETPDKLAARLKRAQENSWESRVQFMMQKIKEDVNEY